MEIKKAERFDHAPQPSFHASFWTPAFAGVTSVSLCRYSQAGGNQFPRCAKARPMFGAGFRKKSFDLQRIGLYLNATIPG